MQDRNSGRCGAVPVVIRPMTLADIREVYAIERESYSLPWPVECFLNEITKNQFARYYVAECECGRIAGYAGMWMIADEGHVTNIAVSPDIRKQKIGERLLVKLIDTALEENAVTMYLEVRRYNLPAQKLYVRYMFRPVRVREGYYQDNNEDAIELRVQDMDTEAFRKNYRERKRKLIETIARSR